MVYKGTKMPGGYVTIMLHMVAEMEKLGAIVKTAASVVDLEVSGLRKITVAQIAKIDKICIFLAGSFSAEAKACTSSNSCKELSNAYFLTKTE